MVSNWVITPIYPIYKQVITHLLTTNPNFQRDIQAEDIFVLGYGLLTANPSSHFGEAARL